VKTEIIIECLIIKALRRTYHKPVQEPELVLVWYALFFLLSSLSFWKRKDVIERKENTERKGGTNPPNHN